MLDKLVEVLNETMGSGLSSRGMVQSLLMDPEATLDTAEELPDGLIVSEGQNGPPFRVTMLGIINTALIQAGEPRRLIAVEDDDGLLLRVEAGPYPMPNPVLEVTETPECDHHWLEWRGHHAGTDEGRLRCTRCSKFKGDT